MELALTSLCLQVGPDQYEKAAAGGGGTGFEGGGFGNPFEDIFGRGGGGGGGGMNDVCHPITNLLMMAYRFSFLVAGLPLFNFVQYMSLFVLCTENKIIFCGSLFNFEFLFHEASLITQKMSLQDNFIFVFLSNTC